MHVAADTTPPFKVCCLSQFAGGNVFQNIPQIHGLLQNITLLDIEQTSFDKVVYNRNCYIVQRKILKMVAT